MTKNMVYVDLFNQNCCQNGMIWSQWFLNYIDSDAFFKMDPNLGRGWFSDNTKHANHIIIIVNEVGFPQNCSNAKECQYNIQQYVEI